MIDVSVTLMLFLKGPYGQDERNCVRLSERNGDLGKGTLEVYKADKHIWMPACIKNWGMTTPTEICSMLGYSSVNSSKMLNTTNNTILPPHNRDTSRNQRQNQNKKTNWLKEFTSCNEKQTATVVELTCANYGIAIYIHYFSLLSSLSC